MVGGSACVGRALRYGEVCVGGSQLNGPGAAPMQGARLYLRRMPRAALCLPWANMLLRLWRARQLVNNGAHVERGKRWRARRAVLERRFMASRHAHQARRFSLKRPLFPG